MLSSQQRGDVQTHLSGFTCYASGQQSLESAERDSKSTKARYCLPTDRKLLEEGDFYSPHRTRLAQHTDKMTA